jgi:hypothetical protein
VTNTNATNRRAEALVIPQDARERRGPPIPKRECGHINLLLCPVSYRLRE